MKDFYNKGSPALHTSKAFLHEENAAKRKALTDVLEILFTGQYVVDRVNQAHDRVLEGSGQGQTVSGDLADISFYNEIERKTALLQNVRAECGVLFYGRYRDNLILVCTDEFAVIKFLRRLRSVGSPIPV